MSTSLRRLTDRLVEVANKSPWIILLTAFLALVGGTVGLIVDLPQLVAVLGTMPLPWRKGIFAALAAIGCLSALSFCSDGDQPNAVDFVIFSKHRPTTARHSAGLPSLP